MRGFETMLEGLLCRQRNYTCAGEEVEKMLIISSWRKIADAIFPYLVMRPLPFFGGAEDVILEVCMSSPIYL